MENLTAYRIVQTRSGFVYAGCLTSETEEGITLRLGDGPKVIPRANIRSCTTPTNATTLTKLGCPDGPALENVGTVAPARTDHAGRRHRDGT